MRTGRTLSWLHISDMHFRADRSWEQDVVLDSLLRDVLARPDPTGLRLDLVFVTGDLAHGGLKSEYEQARRFFEAVAQLTGTDPHDTWFLAPGNHDVDRQRIKRLAQRSASSFEAPSHVNDILADDDSRSLFTCRQHGFFEFTESFLGKDRAWSEAVPWRVETRLLHGLTVAILGLNTSWAAQGGTQDQGRLFLGELQVRRLLADADRSKPVIKIALMHHPLDWLSSFDQDRAKSLLLGKGGVHFLLRGHLHSGRIARQDTPDAQCIELAAGALWQESQHPHGVNIVRLSLDEGRGEVSLFRYSPDARGFWKPDNFLYESIDNGTWQFDLPSSCGLAPAAAGPGSVTAPFRMPPGLVLAVEWDKTRYVAGAELYRALVTITVDEPQRHLDDTAPMVRTRVHHVLVLDVSGSMNEVAKYPLLVAAVDAYVRALADDDLVSLVPFSTTSEVLLRALPVALLRGQSFATEALLGSWPHRFGDTHLSPALRHARNLIAEARQAGFDGVARLLCLTDGLIHDYIQCRPTVHDLRDLGVSFSMFGLGQDFDAPSVDSLVEEADGTVRYVRSGGRDLEEYFCHMARTSQRIVFSDATVSLTPSPDVTCFHAFACRPHERHIGHFADQPSAVVAHHIGPLRYGIPYVYLFELRSWVPARDIATIELVVADAGAGFRVTRTLAPPLGGAGRSVEFVQTMADSLRSLVSDDTGAKLASLEARVDLYKREGRAPQHVAALERQIQVLRAGGTAEELLPDDRRFLAADVATCTARCPPSDRRGK